MAKERRKERREGRNEGKEEERKRNEEGKTWVLYYVLQV